MYDWRIYATRKCAYVNFDFRSQTFFLKYFGFLWQYVIFPLDVWWTICNYLITHAFGTTFLQYTKNIFGTSNAISVFQQTLHVRFHFWIVQNDLFVPFWNLVQQNHCKQLMLFQIVKTEFINKVKMDATQVI